MPTQLLMDGWPGGTPSSASSAGRTIRGSINNTYESNAKPMAAMMQISHCSGVSREGVVSESMAVTSHQPPVTEKYLARVDARGRADEVRRDTITISSAEMIVIGTTGRKPRTVVPAVTRVITSICPIETIGTTLPGGGAVTTDWITATVSTPAAVHTVVASAPHFVLSFQKRAATSSGDNAA